MSFDPLRHLLAAIAYRFHAALADAPEGFRDFDPGGGVRSPRVLVTHCVHVLRIARSSFEPGLEIEEPIRDHLSWDELVDQIHVELAVLDQYIEAGTPTHDWPLESLVQGPFADVLTHVGQLAMLRRMAGRPVERQSYLRARLEAGRLAPSDQPAPSPPML